MLARGVFTILQLQIDLLHHLTLETYEVGELEFHIFTLFFKLGTHTVAELNP